MNGVASRNLDVQTKERSGIVILITLAMGFIMATLDVTVVNVAVVNIQETLGMTLYSSAWIVDGYILSFAALLLAGGALANQYGAKNMYMVGLIILYSHLFYVRLPQMGTPLLSAGYFKVLERLYLCQVHLVY